MKNTDEIFSLNVRNLGHRAAWCWNRNANAENSTRLMEIVLHKSYGNNKNESNVVDYFSGSVVVSIKNYRYFQLMII